MTDKPFLIIPSETKSREFEPKLLLACMAASAGYPVIVGSRIHIHNAIGRLPRGIYFAKDIARSSTRIFKILKMLGFSIVAWDEESLFYAHRTPTFYRTRRTNPENMKLLDALYSWGDQDKGMFDSFSELNEIPVLATGSVRFDFLRPELRSYWNEDVAQLKSLHGPYILLNTNFGRLNHFNSKLALDPFHPQGPAWEQLGRDESTLPYWQFRQKILKELLAAVPQIAGKFPTHTLVIRPHPAENHGIWEQAAKNHPNVVVTHKGNVVPWLIGAIAVIHNGCTTGLEAFLVGTPVFAYAPLTSEEFDEKLPNGVSTEAHDLKALLSLMETVIGNGTIPPAKDAQRLAIRNVANFQGGMAADAILDDISRVARLYQTSRKTGPTDRILGASLAILRQFEKLGLSFLPNHKNSAKYTQHRFPDTTVAEVQATIEKLIKIFPKLRGIAVKSSGKNIFTIHKSSMSPSSLN